MQKLLITVENEELLAALEETLRNDYIVKTSSDGQQARTLVQEFQPELWILDLVLPIVDGITLLREAEENGCHPVTLAIIPYESAYIMGEMCRYEVAYIVKKPCCVEALAGQMQALSATVPQAPVSKPLPAVGVSATLLELSLSPKVDGFGYLTAAIPLLIADPHQTLTKELYTAIGHSFNKSSRQVERSIRTAIDSAWERGDMKIWQRYFPTAPDGTVPRPSNGTFMHHIVARLAQKNAQRGA